MNRRNFMQNAVAGALASAATSQAAPPAAPASNKMIGIQVGAVSFVDEGVNKVLDIFQQVGIGEHAVRRDLHLWPRDRGAAGARAAAARPRHAEIRHRTPFKGGSYTKVHPQYYKDTVLQQFRAPDFGDYDVLEAVIPEARKRGMKTICWFEDVWSNERPQHRAGAGEALRRQQCHHAVLQQSQLPELAAGRGGGLRALLRDRRHHVGIGAAGRVRERAGRKPRRQRRRSRGARPASASSAKPRRRRAASTWRAPARDSRRWEISCRRDARASVRWTAIT